MVDPEKVDAVSQTKSTRLTGTEAWKAHATLAVGLLLCAAAFWFELRRALGGNSLSWAYVFEWPLLGTFAVYMWWKVMNPGSESTSSRGRKKKSSPAIAPEFDSMLAAWQVHQDELSRSREEPTQSEPDRE